MKEEIRLRNTIMEYDHEIKHCKKVLSTGVTGDARKDAQMRLERAEKDKKKIIEKQKGTAKSKNK